MSRRTRRQPRRAPALGFTLVEALVAMAVLSLGILAYVGLQSTLRLQGDVARQRDEAVRLAQTALEEARAYATLDPTPGARAWADLSGSSSRTVAGTNASFQITQRVEDRPDTALKTLVVDVAWQDRHGQPQRLRLATDIAGVSPALAASVGIVGGGAAEHLVRERHRGIPLDAVDQGPVSRLDLPAPGGGQIGWLFDNLSGLIVGVCQPHQPCAQTLALPLSGHIRYATGTAGAPTAADSESPPGAVQPVDVYLDRSHPLPATAVRCVTQLRAHDVRYFCAIGVDRFDTPPRWSGRLRLAGLPWAASRSDPDAQAFRVCRYTPARDHTLLPDGRQLAAHQGPLDLVDVAAALANQNFLVIAAGDGGQAYDCPPDDPITADVDGNTWHHQPPN
jgi:Tfp pilus assembly protein PilV